MRAAHFAFRALVLSCCLLGLAACTASHTPTDITPGAAPVPGGALTALLPPPAALRATSAGEVSVNGKDYNAAWPNANVSAAGTEGLFTPSYAGANRTMADLAYAVYAVGVTGFTGDSTLYFTFTTPFTTGNCWIGLADYAAGNWDWYVLPDPVALKSELVLTLANRDQAGVMPVAVAFTGTADCQLQQLKLGDMTQIGPGGWPMSGHDPQQTFSSPEQGPATNAVRWHASSTGANPNLIFTGAAFTPDGKLLARTNDILYCFAADGALQWSIGLHPLTLPAFATDGTIYFGGAAPAAGLHAVSSAGELLWTYPTTLDVKGAPAVRPDGKIYFGCDDGNLYCLNADGTLDWQHDLVLSVGCSPAVDSAGAVYIGYATDDWGNDGYVLALNADGSEKWEFSVGEPIRSRLAVCANGNVLAITKSGGLLGLDQDGGLEFSKALQCSASSYIVTDASSNIFVGSKAGTLLGLNADGSTAWTYTADSEVLVAPTLDGNGNVIGASLNGMLIACTSTGDEAWTYNTGSSLFVPPAAGPALEAVGNFSGNMFALDLTGALQWQTGTGGPVVGSPVVTTGGTVYFGCADGYLYAARPDGSIKWRYLAGAIGISGSPAIDTTGTIYVGSKDSKLCAVKPDGTELWQFTTTGQIWSSPVIDGAGTIYFGCDDTNVYALYPDGTKKWSFKTKNSVRGSVALGSDGRVYAGCQDSRVYAITPDGTEDWSYKTAGAITGGVCLGSNTIYAGCEKDTITGVVYALSTSGSKQWSLDTVGPVHTAPALLPGGGIVVISSSGPSVQGSIYAISPTGVPWWQYGPASSGGQNLQGGIGLAVDTDGVIYAGTTDGQVLALTDAGSSASVKWSHDVLGALFYTPALDAGRLYIGTATGVLAFGN